LLRAGSYSTISHTKSSIAMHSALRYGRWRHVLRFLMPEMALGVIPNLFDSATPVSLDARISRTCASFNFAVKLFSPRSEVPCRTLSSPFSFNVPHARLWGTLLVCWPSR